MNRAEHVHYITLQDYLHISLFGTRFHVFKHRNYLAKPNMS